MAAGRGRHPGHRGGLRDPRDPLAQPQPGRARSLPGTAVDRAGRRAARPPRPPPRSRWWPSCAAALVAVAELLTGGLLAAALASVPGASVVLRGGIVAYATDLKASLLGVDQAVLDRLRCCLARTTRAGHGRRAYGPGWAPRWGWPPPGWPGLIRPRGSRWAPCTLQLPGGTLGRTPGRLASVTDIIRRLDLAGSRNDIRGQTVTDALALLLVIDAGREPMITVLR